MTICIVIGFILAPLTLGRKFDKFFDISKVTIVDQPNKGGSVMIRGIAYMFSIVLFDTKTRRPKFSGAANLSLECQEFDFRKHAATYDMVISFIFTYSTFLGFFLIGAWYIVRVLLHFFPT